MPRRCLAPARLGSLALSALWAHIHLPLSAPQVSQHDARDGRDLGLAPAPRRRHLPARWRTGHAMSASHQRRCRICRKRPVWIGGDVRDAQGTCKRCYHQFVWTDRPQASEPGRAGRRPRQHQNRYGNSGCTTKPSGSHESSTVRTERCCWSRSSCAKHAHGFKCAAPSCHTSARAFSMVAAVRGCIGMPEMNGNER